MQPIRIIDLDFNLLGEIDNYESLQFTRRFYRPGQFEIHIAIGKRYVDELQKGRIIMLDDQEHKAGYIVSRDVKLNDNGSETVVVKGHTLQGVAEHRLTVTETFDRVRGNAETVMKHYIDNHFVNPTVPNRILFNPDDPNKVPILTIAPNQNRGIETPWQTRYEPLDQVLSEIAHYCDIGWTINLDIANKKWVFDVVEGRNLTTDQTANPPVIFSRKFDNIMSQEFTDTDANYRNVGYAGGKGDDEDQTVVVVGSGAGLDRREVYIDASDAEDAAELIDIGNQKLSGYGQIKTYDGKIIDTRSFVYEKDWDLGDIVTLEDQGWGVQNNTRIIEVREIYEQEVKIEVQLGDEIPTITNVIKTLQNQVKRTTISAGGGAPASSTYTHNQVSPQSTWVIEHELNKHPSVTVVDSGGTVVIGEVNYDNENKITLSFSGVFSGKAYLN